MAPVYAPAYAKVNLSLDVCGRREDGYHLLKTVMQEISLKDDLWAEPWDEIKICCQKADLPLDKNNIIYKVAKAFFAHTGLRDQGIKFTLDKQIPSGAGLGGGSADGVAALRLLDQLFATRLTEEEMVRIVAPIGADLPFFVYGGTALCEGIGERVTPLSPLQKGAFLLVKPPIFMSTPKIFGILDSVAQPDHPDVEAMIAAVGREDLAAIGRQMGNSLQSAGVEEYDFILPLRDRLMESGALGAMLSGSGSTVYGMFETEEKARIAAQQFAGENLFCGVFVPISSKSE